MTTHVLLRVSPFQMFYAVILLLSFLSFAASQGPICSHATGRTDESSVYVSYSLRPLTESDISHEDFSDFGKNYEEGLFCDPALFFDGAAVARYYNAADQVEWTTIPTDITMFNITLLQTNTEFDLDVVQLERFSSLQSLGLRGTVINNITTSFLQNFPHLNILDLSGNDIKVLPKGLLQPLPDLMIFLFHDNDLQEYHADLFCNLPKLFSINMNYAFHDGTFPSTLFSSKGIDGMNVTDCNDTQTFGNIQIVRLSRNNFPVLPEAAFDRLHKINNELQIAGSGINMLDHSAFVGLRNLSVLILDDNNITQMPSTLFQSMINLTQFTVKNNSLQSVSGQHFSTNTKVSALVLSHNYLKELSGTWGHLRDMFFLDASYNRIERLGKNTISNIGNNLYQLYLNDNEINFIEPGAFAGMGNGPFFHLHLQNNNLTYLDPQIFYGMTNLFELLLYKNKLREIDAALFRNKPNLKSIYLDSNEISTIHEDTFESVPHLMILTIADNSITNLHKDTLSNKMFLETLDISRNKISELHDDLFKDMVNVKHFWVDSNNLTYFNGSILEGWSSSLELVGLGDNPWNCTCDIYPLISWVREHENKLFKSIKAFCRYPPSLSGTALQEVPTEECIPDGPSNYYIYIIIGVVCAVALCALLFAFVVYYRTEIEVLLFIKFNIRLRKPVGLTPEEEAQMKYDAFVSFNQEDLLFVKHELMPKLEKECEPPFKLCVHFRDFALGVPIADNISNAIDYSRKTILLLSRNFLSSEWCQYEFQQVHYRVMTEGKGRLIIILMEDIPAKEINDKPLRTYITTHTYLHRKDALFWERLRFEMPQKPAQEETEQSVQSFQKPSVSSISSSTTDEAYVNFRKGSSLSTEPLVDPASVQIKL